jgi:hypothetical protein
MSESRGEQRQQRSDLVATRFQHFGEALRYYRETYQDRVSQDRVSRDNPDMPDMPYIRMTALSLVDCMRRKGYLISSRAYSGIEAGEREPKKPIAFLTAAQQCLALNQAQHDELKFQLAYDVLVRELDSAELADEALRFARK